MLKLPISLCAVLVIIKYVEAGVITSVSGIRDANRFDDAVQYPKSNNDIPDEFEIRKKTTIATKYWVSKNIPLFKKIPKAFAKTANKLTKYPDSFYKELYGINKIEDKVKTRVHNLINTNIKLKVNQPLPISIYTRSNDDEQKENNSANNIEDAVEVSLSDDDATTEDSMAINEDEKMPDRENQKLLNQFIRSHTVIPTKSDCHSDSSEEKKDLDEFIFMLDSNGPEEDVVDDGDVEMTTPFFVEEPRIKRGVNVIEEENMGTTISGFKFTGREASLTSDLYFKNIHS